MSSLSMSKDGGAYLRVLPQRWCTTDDGKQFG